MALAGVGFVAAAVICALAFASLLNSRVAFWPPEQHGPTQRRFRWLFRAMFYAALLATLWHLWQEPPPPTLSTLLAVCLAALGFGGALFATGLIGWSVAFGDTGKLATSGPFAVSRHPVYVATWLGLIGWAILTDVTLIRATLALWALFYLIAIFLEEPWLERVYGQDYAAYKRRTARLFGLPRRI